MDRHRIRRRSRRNARDCSATLAGVPWNSRNSIGVSGSDSLECRLTARTCSASSSSMRATGMPDWIVRIVARQHASTEGNGHTPPAIASGMPASLQRQFGDDSERAFRSDQQPRQVVSGRRFLGAPRGGHHLAIRRAPLSAKGHCPSWCRSAPRWCRSSASPPCRRARRRRRDRWGRTRPGREAAR